MLILALVHTLTHILELILFIHDGTIATIYKCSFTMAKRAERKTKHMQRVYPQIRVSASQSATWMGFILKPFVHISNVEPKFRIYSLTLYRRSVAQYTSTL